MYRTIHRLEQRGCLRIHAQTRPNGAIFLIPGVDWQNKNKCLHGHNMDDGSMFAPLLQLTHYKP